MDVRPIVCNKCHVPHVENCPKCWGFGLNAAGSPIRASESMEWGDQPYTQCPVCNGTPFGVKEVVNNET